MKKHLGWICLVLVMFMLVPAIVLASYEYSIPIEVYNNDSSSWSGPVLITLNNSQLVDLGYIVASGLDTDVQEGATARDYMVADARLGLYIPSMDSYQERTYSYRLGQSPAASNFSVVVGCGGYFNITDHADLELGANFSVTFQGGVNTSPEDFLYNTTIYAGEAYNSSWDVGYLDDEGSQSKESDHLYLEVSDADDGATRTYVTNGTVDLSSVETIWIEWANTGDAVGDNESYLIASTSHDGSYTTYDAQFKALGDFARGWSELDVSGLKGSYYIRVHAHDDDSYNADQSEILVYNVLYSTAPFSPRLVEKEDSFHLYVEEGSLIAVMDDTPDLNLTIPLSTGSYLVEVWADETNFGIDIDGSTENSTALGGASVPDNANEWEVSVPYFDYYNHYVNNTLEAQYLPNTMILGTSLTDRTGNGHTGTIIWGSNPSNIEVSLGGITPYSAYTQTDEEGADEAPWVIPDTGTIPTAPATGATGVGLPLYDRFKVAADSLDWTVPVTYSVMFIIVAIVMGVAGLSVMGSGWGFTIGCGSTMAFFSQVRDGGGYTIVPVGMVLAVVIVSILLGYLWSRT